MAYGAKTYTINSSNFSPGAYSGTWTTDVKMNGRRTESSVHLTSGVNTIRIYAVDPTFVLQKLVVSEDSVKTSHFGPGESYYVGKNVGGKTALPLGTVKSRIFFARKKLQAQFKDYR